MVNDSLKAKFCPVPEIVELCNLTTIWCNKKSPGKVSCNRKVAMSSNN